MIIWKGCGGADPAYLKVSDETRRNTKTWDNLADSRTEIWNRDLPNTEREIKLHKNGYDTTSASIQIWFIFIQVGTVALRKKNCLYYGFVQWQFHESNSARDFKWQFINISLFQNKLEYVEPDVKLKAFVYFFVRNVIMRILCTRYLSVIWGKNAKLMWLNIDCVLVTNCRI